MILPTKNRHHHGSVPILSEFCYKIQVFNRFRNTDNLLKNGFVKRNRCMYVGMFKKTCNRKMYKLT